LPDSSIGGESISTRLYGISKVLDRGIWAWEYKSDMTVIGPLDQIGRLSVLTVDFDNPPISIRLSAVTLHD
jgi:hypothetical protein